MLSIEHLTIEFSSKPVLDDISFLVNKKDRIALVGKNGAGKTTLLRLIAGEYTPTSGTISKDADLTIGYLPQVMLHKDGRTLREEVMSICPTSNSDSGPTSNSEALFIAEMDKTIIGLGFERKDFDRPCSEFSGGWRMRIELAKILLQHPDLLLLDEPTNHLDIESIQWLEDFLAASPSAVIVVSHDRAFIDNITNRTIEISLGRIYDYNVNYSQFVVLRQERHYQQVRAYLNQQKMIQETEEFIVVGPFAGWNKQLGEYKKDQQGQADIYRDVIAWGKDHGLIGIRYWAPDYEGEWYPMSMFTFENKVGTAKTILLNHKSIVEQ